MERPLDIDLDPDARTLQRFGVLAALASLVLALLCWFERGPFAFGLGSAREPAAYGLVAFALVSLGFCLLYPRGNRPLYVALTLVGYSLGLFMSYAVLIVLFYGVLGVVALAQRAAGRDALERGLDAGAQSYFRTPRRTRDLERYFRQY